LIRRGGEPAPDYLRIIVADHVAAAGLLRQAAGE
jgi:hypothetical protein